MSWIGPAIGAAGSLGGAALGSKGANRQARFNQQALDFEKQKFEEEQMLARNQWDAMQRAYAPYLAAREARLRSVQRRWGMKVPEASSRYSRPASDGTLRAMAGRSPAPMARAETRDASRTSLGSIAGL